MGELNRMVSKEKPIVNSVAFLDRANGFIDSIHI